MSRVVPRLTPLEPRETPASLFAAFGAAPGGLPLVQLNRPDGTQLARFSAFEDTFRGGVRAAAGELDGNPNTVELVAAAGPGGGPAVKVYAVDVTTGAVRPTAAFFAYEPTFRGGTRVAVGNVVGRLGGVGQIVVGAGEGGGPRVRTLEADGRPVADSTLADFFAYEPSFRGGVGVAAGELDGRLDDGDELVAVAGTGGGPRVRVIRSDGAILADYFAFRSDFRGGVNVLVPNAAFGAANSVLRADALALDPSQRNAALNSAAVVTGTGAATPGATSVVTAGGGQTLVPGVGGAIVTPAGGVSAATASGGIGGNTTAAGVTGNVFGQTGVSGNTAAGGISTASTGGGVSQATAATGVGGVTSGTTGLFNTQAGGVVGSTTAAGVSANTAAGDISRGTTATAGGVTGPLPSVTAFGPFGDPGVPLLAPVFATPIFAPSRVRYDIPV